MSEIRKDSAGFIGYEYKEIPTRGERASMYLDYYPSFGWEIDERTKNGTVTLKRDRKIINKMELTRLQRHFEACMNELDQLERSKTATATVVSIIIGLIGTFFMGGAVFMATHEPPLWIPCLILAIPAFAGWILPYFVYKILAAKRAKVVAELMEQKYDEIYEICEQGNRLLL